MTSWDERFREGDYPARPDPSPVLRRYVDSFPDGRALDVATGTGRNALFLAEQGYEVDALDRSREGLAIARRNARADGLEVNWLQADADEYPYPASTYDVVTVSFYRTLDRLGDIKAALKPGGVLFYQHHLQSADAVEVGPDTDRYRFRANELLRACLDLTVLYYTERTVERDDGRTAANVVLVGRRSAGGEQSSPRVDWDRDD